jgi:Fic family protein
MNEKQRIAEVNNRKLIALRPLHAETLKSLKDYYRIGLTFSSNAMEGNSLTESETKVVIEDGLTIEGKPLRDVYEAVGHAKAYDQIYQLSTHKTLEEADILMLHRLFYQQIDADQAGYYRSVSVFISGSKFAVTPPKKIATEMKKFVEWFNKTEATTHPIDFAALVHKKFVFIHPFIDGNGRLARLLMNLALLRNEYSIALIPVLLRHEYIAALEQAHTDDHRFREFIADRIIATQVDLLRLLADSGGVNYPNGGVNYEIENKNGGVNSMEQQIMETLEKMPGLNAPALATAQGKSLRTIQRNLKILCDNGKLEFRGSSKKGGYFLMGSD